MLREQNRSDSKVMIVALLSAISIIVKEVAGYEIPDKLINDIIVIVQWFIVFYGIGNSPRVKGEY